MKIVARKGFEMDIQVSGFQGRGYSEILVSFSFGGKNVKNEPASIVRNGKITEGISLPRLNGYVECAVSEIEKAVSELPEKPKSVKSDNFTIDADGDIIVINRKEQAILEAKRNAQTKERINKQNLENIMLDNESEGIDPMNGITK